MNLKDEYKSLLWMSVVFLSIYFMPLENLRFQSSIYEALRLLAWYAREHVLLCLLPAFFIAGTISVFISQAAVIKYFGASAKKWLAYLVASVSGTILAVCSCTVLPMFAGIHKRGAGLGPAIAFLYSGPAINILAIILTARILGLELGVARVIGAVVFSIVIGLIMHLIYRKEECIRAEVQLSMPVPDGTRPFWHTAFHFFVLVAILVFANWGKPDIPEGVWHFIYAHKWAVTAISAILLMISLVRILKIKPLYVIGGMIPVLILGLVYNENPQIAFLAGAVILTVLTAISPGEPRDWLESSWGFAKQIMPLLAMGVLISGFLLGSQNGQGIIPANWISGLVGGNSLFANFFASIVGAFMYFATLTEVPIVQGLINSGMGKGPALALLLAGPALSLPSMLVIRSVIGTGKTVVYVSLVVGMATISGLIFGAII